MNIVEKDINDLIKNAKRVNTHDLNLGDLVINHSSVFKLIKRRHFTAPSDLHFDPKGTLQFDTECIYHGESSAIPKDWINREGGWVIQGNSHARWLLIDK